MKKGTIIAIFAIGVLAAAAGGALVQKARDENKFNYPWESSSSGGTSQPGQSSDSGHGSDSTSTSADGSLKAVLAGGPRFAAKAGATKACVATIVPANATDKTILWSTSDAAKVSLASATTQSGASQTLTLKAVFNGTVTVAAKAEALQSASVLFSVTVYNAVAKIEPVAVIGSHGASGVAMAGYLARSPSASWDPTPAESDGVYTLCIPGTHDIEMNVGALVHYAALSAAGAVTYKTCGDDDDLPALLVMRAWGRDEGASPDADVGSLKSYFGFAAASKDGKAYYVAKELRDTTGAALPFSFEDASVSVATAAYVAPTGVTGGGSVRFS